MELTPRHIQIITYITTNQSSSSSAIAAAINGDYSERTIQRDLRELVDAGFLNTTGSGPALTYAIAPSGTFFIPYNPTTYTELPPEQRPGAATLYQSTTWGCWPDNLFTPLQYQQFTNQTDSYQQRISQQSLDVQKKELERFVIELSWKSSRIEGNTYTLLDTELLLRDGIASAKNTPEETRMIVNHKEAFTFVREQAVTMPVSVLSIAYIEQVQRLLMKGLLTDLGLRKNAVGITGSTYRPLDNQFQIEEELTRLVQTINSNTSVYEQALTALLGISYLQPFVGGNKRTARLVANGLLLSGGAAPFPIGMLMKLCTVLHCWYFTSKRASFRCETCLLTSTNLQSSTIVKNYNKSYPQRR
jgi:Fic family protein